MVFFYFVLMSCMHVYGYVTMHMQKPEDTQATNQDFVSKLNNYKNVTSKCQKSIKMFMSDETLKLVDNFN